MAFHVSFLSLDRSQNDSRLTVFLTEGKESLPLANLVLSAFGERFRVWPYLLWTGFNVPSLSYALRYCFGMCVSVRM